MAVGRGHRDARLGRAAFASGCRSSRERCAGCGAPRGGRQAASPRLRRGMTAGAAPTRPLVRGAPISGRGSHCKGGVASTPGPRPKLWGALGRKYKAGRGRSAALRWRRASRRPTPRALKPTFEKCPFERKRPPPSPPAGTARGKFCFLFQIILATLTV